MKGGLKNEGWFVIRLQIQEQIVDVPVPRILEQH